MQAPGEQEGPPRRKRRRRWDQGPAAAPDPDPTTCRPQQPPPQPLAAAQHAVAHHLAAQQAVAHLQTTPHAAAQQGVVGGVAAAAPATAAPVSAPLEATVDLCACGADARRALCSRKTQADITSSTGCSLTTRGRYRKEDSPSIVSHLPSSPTRSAGPPGEGGGADDGLHLHIQGPTQAAVDGAVALINRRIADADRSVPAARPPVALARALQARVPVGLAPAPGFDVCARILGPNGQYLAHIASRASCSVSLRGVGSAQDPLAIVIEQARDQQQLALATDLVQSLLATLRAEHTRLTGGAVAVAQQYAASAPPPQVQAPPRHAPPGPPQQRQPAGPSFAAVPFVYNPAAAADLVAPAIPARPRSPQRAPLAAPAMQVRAPPLTQEPKGVAMPEPDAGGKSPPKPAARQPFWAAGRGSGRCT